MYLTNLASEPISIRRLEVLNASAKGADPIASFEAERLTNLMRPVSSQPPEDLRKIGPGTTEVLFLWISLEKSATVPTQLIHRLLTVDSQIQGALVETHHTTLKVLGPPVQGENWLASDGPSNDPDNHHRRGLFVFNGHAGISRRYAIDWMQVKDGALFVGDGRDSRSYYSYGKDVLAVADGKVVTARDGLPDNVPGHNENFHPAVPITPDTVAGNTIVLDLWNGQFAHYMHLQPGSVRVKTGDRVRRGQVLARIGSSGDARGPHLHFHVSTSANPLAGEGVPYVINQYRTNSDGTVQTRIRELPLGGMRVDFGQQ